MATLYEERDTDKLMSPGSNWHEDVWVVTSIVLAACTLFITLAYCAYCCVRAPQERGRVVYGQRGSLQSGWRAWRGRWWWWSHRYGLPIAVYPPPTPPPGQATAPGTTPYSPPPAYLDPLGALAALAAANNPATPASPTAPAAATTTPAAAAAASLPPPPPGPAAPPDALATPAASTTSAITMGRPKTVPYSAYGKRK